MFSISSFTCQAKSAFYFPGQTSEICEDSELFQLVSPFEESNVPSEPLRQFTGAVTCLNYTQLSVWWLYVGEISLVHLRWEHLKNHPGAYFGTLNKPVLHIKPCTTKIIMKVKDNK